MSRTTTALIAAPAMAVAALTAAAPDRAEAGRVAPTVISGSVDVKVGGSKHVWVRSSLDVRSGRAWTDLDLRCRAWTGFHATAYVAYVDGAGRVVATYQTPTYGTGARTKHRPAHVDHKLPKAVAGEVRTIRVRVHRVSRGFRASAKAMASFAREIAEEIAKSKK